MYWLLRHDLELLGQAEEILGNIGFPQPYPGWSSGGLGDGVIPYQIKSSPIFTKPPLKEPYVGKFAQYPQEWQAMFEQYGIPQVYLNISSPPLWVAAGMTTLGGSLSRAPHPGARFLGYVLADVGGVLIIWIAVEDDIEADDDE